MPPEDPAGATPDPAGDGGTPDDGATPASTGDVDANAFLAAAREAGIDDPAKVLETLKKLRPYERGEKVPAKVEKELEALRAQVKAHEDEKLSEQEKLTVRVKELEEELGKREAAVSTLQLEREVSAAAATVGALYPDDIMKLLDTSKIERDDDGKPTNLDAMLGDLKKSRPVLFGQKRPPSLEGGGRSPADSGSSMDDRLRRATGRA